MTPQEQVEAFHRAFDTPVLHHPTLVKSRLALRRALIAEEHAEWVEASEGDDLAEIAKELADMLYVIYGTFAELGIDGDEVFAEVHRSNMTKLWTADDVERSESAARHHEVVRFEQNEDGTWACYRADGKVLKPPTYSPADLGWVNRQANMPRP